FPPPAVFLAVPGSPAVAWPAWKRSCLSFLDASGLRAVEPRRKKAMLFSLLGTEGQRIVDAFNSMRRPSLKEPTQRRKFREMIQRPGETVSEFLAQLRRQGSFCAFGDNLDERLCEAFLEGLDSKRVQDRILRECTGSEVPTLSRSIQLALQYEQSAKKAESFDRHEQPQASAPAEVQRVQERAPIRTPSRPSFQDGGPWPSSSTGAVQYGQPGYPPWPYHGFTPSQPGPRMSWAPAAYKQTIS
ncbi:hypothetical protein HPB47_016708, partial [Ixodes persulcatus]